MKKLLKKKILIFIFLPLFILIFFFFILPTILFFNFDFSLSEGKDMSRQEIAIFFYQHKSEFEQMSQELFGLQDKGLSRLDDTWSDPENLEQVGLDENARKNLWKRLERLNTPRGVYCTDESIKYIMYSFGLSVSGRSEGLLYSKNEPVNYFKCDSNKYQSIPYSLEDPKPETKCSYEIYTKIEDNWYIFEELED